jgi:hypothetical protein
MSFDSYLAPQQSNVDQVRQLPHFTQLAEPVHALYARSAGLVPKTADAIFGRLFLLSHRNLLSAATLVLRKLPDDAAAVTRRALETARIALAIKYDPTNLQRWLSLEQRMARWDRRQKGEKRRDLHLGLTYPPGNRICEELMSRA